MKKAGIILSLSLWMVFMLPFTVFAAETNAFLEGSEVDQTQIRIICSDIIEGEEEQAEDFTISLGSQPVPVTSLERANETVIATTYYCLVDVSGSMNADQMAQVQDVLMEICHRMQDGDNMIIGTLGNQTSSSGFLTDKTEIADMISALEAGNEDTNLYAGIVESISQLQSEEGVNTRKCLVILSDGRDDQKTGITKEEADQAIVDSSIPVYTIATLKASPNDEQLEDAKLLGSFARSSTGGAHYVPVVEGIDGGQIGTDICDKLSQGITITVDTSEIESFGDKDVLLLRVIYTAENGNEYEDTLDLYAEDIELLEQAQEEIAEPAPEEEEVAPEPTVEDTEEPEEAAMGWIWIILIAIVVIVAIVIIIFLKKKKANTSEINSEDDGSDVADGEVNENADSEDSEVSDDTITDDGEDLGETQIIPPGGYELRLYAIGYKHIRHSIILAPGTEVTIGRNDKADIILDPEDKKLSSVHCRVRWENDKLYVWDANSTNGTFVNGIPIRALGRVAAHEGETIRMGSYEYRIGRPGEEEHK